MPGPRLLSIVLNYRTPDLSLRAAEAALVAMQGIEGELIIVDNDSGDGSEERLRAGIAAGPKAEGWDRVRFLQTGRNGGFGAGNNAGIRAGLSDGSAPDYVYILNPDAAPEPQAIHALVAYLEAHPETGFAGSFIYGTSPDDPHSTAFRFPSLWSELEGAAHFGPLSRLLRWHIVAMEMPGATCEVDWTAGASLMLRWTMLDEVGLFDEDYFLYFEETDLCLRARRGGWRTAYICESQVSHIGSVSTGMKTWTRVPRYWFDSRLRYFVKNHGTLYAALATALHLMGAVFWRARRLVDRRARARREPERFVRDMTIHALGAAFGTRKRPHPQPSSAAGS